jgi:small-conductance mechanosensitive channel
MHGNRLLVALFLLFATLALPALAQTGDAAEKPLDLEEVRELRDRAASDTALSGDVRTRVLELYDGAISSLEAAAASQIQTRNLTREQDGIDNAVQVLRRQLEQPDPDPQLSLPEDATVERAESELARERAKLAAERTALTNLERTVEEQTASRTDISRRLGTLDQELQAINDELLAVTQAELHRELKRATRMDFRAKRARVLTGAETLRAQLALLDVRSAVLPLQIDLAQRHVDHSVQIVTLLEQATNDLRRAAAARQLNYVRELSRTATECSELLAAVAAETQQLAETLWGAEGVEARSEQTARAIAATRKHQADLDRIIQLTRRKFEAFGHRGSVTRWWPDVPDDFPEPGDVDVYVDELRRRIPEAQHELIRLEQQRSEARALASNTMEALRTAEGETIDPELQRIARDLLNQRRELLDDAIQAFGRYSNQLVELETKSSYFLGEVRIVQEFLYERFLWVRSVPRPIIPRFEALAPAAGWMTSGWHLAEFFSALWRSFAERPGRGLGILLLFGLLLGLRRGMRRRLLTLAERVASPETDRYRHTLGALLYTLLLAAPLPLAL